MYFVEIAPQASLRTFPSLSREWGRVRPSIRGHGVPGSGSDPPPGLMWVLFLPPPEAGTIWPPMVGTEVSRGPRLLAGCLRPPSAPRAREQNYNLAKLRRDRSGSCLLRSLPHPDGSSHHGVHTASSCPHCRMLLSTGTDLPQEEASFVGQEEMGQRSHTSRERRAGSPVKGVAAGLPVGTHPTALQAKPLPLLIALRKCHS